MNDTHRHHGQFNNVEIRFQRPIDDIHSLRAAVIDIVVDKIVTYEEFFRGVALQVIHTRK